MIAPSACGDYSHITGAQASGTPIVCLDQVPSGIKVDSITVDNMTGARDCVRHLLELGHHEIAIITGSTALQTARQRLEGSSERSLKRTFQSVPNGYKREIFGRSAIRVESTINRARFTIIK